MSCAELTKKYHETHTSTVGLSGDALEAVYMQRLERLDSMFKENQRMKVLQEEMRQHVR